MNSQNSKLWTVVKAVVVAAGLLAATAPAYATKNAAERRDARDTKQESRQDAHSAKVDCRAANEKNNAECRQDKRNAKQSGREDSRAVRAGAEPKK